MSYGVFISYSSQNQSDALHLERKLKSNGLSCFLAPMAIIPGEVVDETIRLALLSSGVVCLLATKEALASEWVMTEWGAAWALEKPLIPVLLRCDRSDLPVRLQKLQCIDFHKAPALAKSIRELGHRATALHSPLAKIAGIASYGSIDFQEHHEHYLREPISALWLWSYTGETTNGMLVGFQEMALDINVRLLIRDWRHEAQDESLYNANHPQRPRDWDKARHIKHVALNLPRQPWARGGGGRIRFEQRFYTEFPVNKMILYINNDEPKAAFFGFYKLDPDMTLGHPSIYVDVGQPMMRIEDAVFLRYLADEFRDRWGKARTVTDVEGD
jgi:hypothetical protein